MHLQCGLRITLRGRWWAESQDRMDGKPGPGLPICLEPGCVCLLPGVPQRALLGLRRGELTVGVWVTTECRVKQARVLILLRLLICWVTWALYLPSVSLSVPICNVRELLSSPEGLGRDLIGSLYWAQASAQSFRPQQVIILKNDFLPRGFPPHAVCFGERQGLRVAGFLPPSPPSAD